MEKEKCSVRRRKVGKKGGMNEKLKVNKGRTEEMEKGKNKKRKGERKEGR